MHTSGLVRVLRRVRVRGRWVFEVAGGYGWSAIGCMKDFSEFSGCLWGHTFALNAFVKECVNADAARVRDGAATRRASQSSLRSILMEVKPAVADLRARAMITDSA